MNFKKNKHDFLSLEWNNPMLGVVQVGADWIERCFQEINLGLVTDIKLNVTQQCVLAAEKANSILGCISKSVASKLKDMIHETAAGLVCLILGWPQ